MANKMPGWAKSSVAILAIAGGLNWLLVGALDYNLVMELVGDWPAVENLVYILAGASGIWTGWMAWMK